MSVIFDIDVILDTHETEVNQDIDRMEGTVTDPVKNVRIDRKTVF